MTSRRALALVAGTALVLSAALVACGDDPSDEGVPAGGATTAAAPATTAASGGGAATTAASAETTAAAATTAAAGSTTTVARTTTTTVATASGEAAIVAVDFAFNPQNIKVTAGTKVTWTNNDSATHQIVSKGDPFPGDGTIESGQSYSVTFDAAGTYDYFCGIHNSMTGSIVVS